MRLTKQDFVCLNVACNTIHQDFRKGDLMPVNLTADWVDPYPGNGIDDIVLRYVTGHKITLEGDTTLHIPAKFSIVLEGKEWNMAVRSWSSESRFPGEQLTTIKAESYGGPVDFVQPIS